MAGYNVILAGGFPQRESPPPPSDLHLAWIEAYQHVEPTTIAGRTFYIRPLTRGELNTALQMGGGPTPIAEEQLCQRACVWPLDYDFSDPTQLAGVIPSLAKRIIDLSGFSPESSAKLYSGWQERMYDQDMRRDLLVLGVFKSLTFDALDAMTQDEYFKYLAAAAFLEQTQIFTSGAYPEYDPSEFVDLLLCNKEQLVQRIAKAKKDRAQMEATAQQREQEELIAQQPGQQRAPRPDRPQPYVAPPPNVLYR